MPQNLHDYQLAAQRLLPAMYYDYVAGGSGDELTLADNRLAFDRWRVLPRVLRNIADPGLATTVLGQPVSMPILVAPMATSVSDNGKVVVGVSAPRPLSFESSTGWDFDTSDTRAFRWTPATGLQGLTQVLAGRGTDITGITLLAALAVSPDGQFIGGVR